jgi:hypothetical protein
MLKKKIPESFFVKPFCRIFGFFSLEKNTGTLSTVSDGYKLQYTEIKTILNFFQMCGILGLWILYPDPYIMNPDIYTLVVKGK